MSLILTKAFKDEHECQPVPDFQEVFTEVLKNNSDSGEGGFHHFRLRKVFNLRYLEIFFVSSCYRNIQLQSLVQPPSFTNIPGILKI